MHRSSQRGSALIVALGFMVLVLVIGAGVQGLVVGQLRGSGDLRERTTADYVARGGIARAVAWFTSSTYQLPQASQLSGVVPVLLGKGGSPVVLPSNHPDSYTDAFGTARTGVATSFNSYLTAQKMPVGKYSVTASLIATQPETWEILAVGEYGTTAQRTSALLVRKQEALFSGALFGGGSLAMSGNAYTDSYDSSRGAFGGSNIGNNGEVASNGDITISGNAQANGNAVPGPDQDVTLAGKGKVTGSTTSATNPKSLPVPAVPANAINLGAITLSGTATQTLTTGTYVVSSLSVSGSGGLEIDSSAGPVTLYVTGIVSISGKGIANLNGKPSDFAIVQVGGAQVTLSGSSTLYGTIYAPNSLLTLTGTNVLFGGIIGATVSVTGGATFHYDENLRTTTTTAAALRLMSQWSHVS